jgi:plasmid maintenance system antidote protein VapI
VSETATFNNLAPNPWEFISEEMAARGWSKDDLASRMGYNTIDEWQIDRVSLDFLEVIRMPNARLGETTIQKLSSAFGVSADLFRNMQDAWLARPDLEEICAKLTENGPEPSP